MGAGMSLSRRRILLNEPHIATASGAIASFSTDLAIPLKSCVIGIEAVQSGSGDPSPDNVRPINGWTGANVCRSVYNFINPKSDDFITQGSISLQTGEDTDSNTRIRSDYVDLDAGTYTISNDNNYNVNINVSIRAYSNADMYIKSESTQSWQASPYTFTLSESRKIRFVWRKSNDDAITPGDLTNPILCSGTSAHLQKYSVAWQSTAGTVYGGALDVVTGVLTVTWAEIDMGSITCADSTAFGGCFELYVNGYKSNIGNVICEIYKTVTSSAAFTDKTIYARNNGTRIFVKDSAYVDAAAFKTAMSGVKLVYELATPVTYQLTPTQMTALRGQNNIWADTGSAQAKYWTH